ncbi:transcriptional regulator, CdaR family [Desulfitobacterium dehalogenans ATCC 51507]|uniref:Transcriptional regulator, CdaR family n=2 Tax=Desulfitobacteriaceae TaxID=2937909 RepID=I4A8J0_DESDJ|nr:MULTISPECIES: helix-turn-helix domain-containing protein [Desulfitobacterium]AFM00275.1 transcriptional regulator, CdaR family [Desulfitobacterium dehalogenans ATCC 51507]
MMEKNTSMPNPMRKLLKMSGKGLDALTCALAEVLNQPILVATPAYETISTTLLHPDLDAFRVEIEGDWADNESIFFCTLSTEALRLQGAGWAVAPNGRVLGYLFVLYEQTEPDFEGLQPIIETALSLYAIHLQNKLELKQEKHKTKNSFFYDLLYGNLKRNEDIITMGEVWGWDFRRPHRVLLLATELEHHSPDWHLMEVLQKIVDRTLINKFYKNPATTVNRNEVVAIIPGAREKGAEQKQEILSIMEHLSGQFQATAPQYRISCGVGQAYTHPNDLFRSYQEAKVACEMGSLLEVAVPFFSEMGLERILYKHDLEDLKEYYHHVLGALPEDEGEDNLLSLLESFVDNQFDMNKTAQATFLHRNTLRYRLNKIEALLDRSLTDIDTRLDLAAAFKIRRLHKERLASDDLSGI